MSLRSESDRIAVLLRSNAMGPGCVKRPELGFNGAQPMATGRQGYKPSVLLKLNYPLATKKDPNTPAAPVLDGLEDTASAVAAVRNLKACRQLAPPGAA